MRYPKRSQFKYAKSQYQIRNWPLYEAGLRRRGDLTVWLSEDAINPWQEPPCRRRTRSRGKGVPELPEVWDLGSRVRQGPVLKLRL